LTLHIGNINYSSWSMRAGVLLRAFDIDFTKNLIIFDSFQADSTFKQSVLQLTPTGTVPLLAEDTLKTRQGQPLVVTDTLSIVEFIAERYPHHAIWPRDLALRNMARNLCAEMHSGFVALRQHPMMNIGPDLSHAGAIVWRDQPTVCRDVARIEAAWAICLAQSDGPF
jgi:glutathione S-transferase